jgi:hypothetical protein
MGNDLQRKTEDFDLKAAYSTIVFQLVVAVALKQNAAK